MVEVVNNMNACHWEEERFSQRLEGSVGLDGGIRVEHSIVVDMGVGDLGVVRTLALMKCGCGCVGV